MTSFRAGFLPAPARSHADPDADPRAPYPDARSVIAAVVPRVTVIRTVAAVISAVIPPSTDQRTSRAPAIAAGDGFDQIGLRERSADSGSTPGRHRLGAADRQKAQGRHRRRGSGRQ